MSDLRNLKVLAWFLQKFELDFDILSSLRELSKQIKGEFDFRWAFLVQAVIRDASLCNYIHHSTVYFFMTAFFLSSARRITGQSAAAGVHLEGLMRYTTRADPIRNGSYRKSCFMFPSVLYTTFPVELRKELFSRPKRPLGRGVCGCTKSFRSPELTNALRRSNCAMPTPTCIESCRSPELQRALRHSHCAVPTPTPPALYCYSVVLVAIEGTGM